MSKNKNLILVRAGEKSLHPQWIDDSAREWDIALSYFGEYPSRYINQYDYLHIFKGSKWEGINDFFLNKKDLINDYKYVWMPDDDILTDCLNINNFFKITEQLNLTISQPALTSYSYCGWEITRQAANSFARSTNFVEIMAPCFRVEALPFFSETFRENSSGWGYEWLWWDIACKNNINNFAIIDATPVHHTRPVGQAGHGGSKNDPREEMKLLMQKYKLELSSPTVLERIFTR